jgi:hypothetical protein
VVWGALIKGRSSSFVSLTNGHSRKKAAGRKKTFYKLRSRVHFESQPKKARGGRKRIQNEGDIAALTSDRSFRRGRKIAREKN